MLEQIFGIISSLSSWAVALIPIFTIIGLVVPKVRHRLGIALKGMLGIDELNTQFAHLTTRVEKMETCMEDMQNEVSTVKNILDGHLEFDEKKMKVTMLHLKDNLMQSFCYYTERGYILIEELNVLQEVYESYIDFKGNGVIKSKWENVILKLPNKPIKK